MPKVVIYAERISRDYTYDVLEQMIMRKVFHVKVDICHLYMLCVEI